MKRIFDNYEPFYNMLLSTTLMSNSVSAEFIDDGRKIIDFIATRAEVQDGCKTLQIKMEDLADILDETRINVSSALNLLQKKGLVELRRKEIHIPSFKLLTNFKEKTA